MLLRINGKLNKGKLKSSRSNVLNRPPLSISRFRSKYVADIAVSVASFISSSMGYMPSTKSQNIELFSEMYVGDSEIKDWASFFSFS